MKISSAGDFYLGFCGIDTQQKLFTGSIQTHTYAYALTVDNRFRRQPRRLISPERAHKSLYERCVTNSRLVADFIAWQIARRSRGFYAVG